MTSSGGAHHRPSSTSGPASAINIPSAPSSHRSSGIPVPGSASGPGRQPVDIPEDDGLFSMPFPGGSPIVGTPMGYLVRGSWHTVPHTAHAAGAGSLARTAAAPTGLAHANAANGMWRASADQYLDSHQSGTYFIPSQQRGGVAGASPGARPLQASVSPSGQPHQLQQHGFEAKSLPTSMMTFGGPGRWGSLALSPQPSSDGSAAGGTMFEDVHHMQQQQQQQHQRPPVAFVRPGGGAGIMVRSSLEAQQQVQHLPQQQQLLQHKDSLQEPLLEERGADAAAAVLEQGTVPADHAWQALPASPTAGPTATAASAAAAARGLSLDQRGAQQWGRDAGTLKALVFGMINGAVGLPALIAFAAIVFKAPVYGAFLDTLCRFFFLSSAIHQLVFVLLSSLPFAIGQVQDVGLIFLSAMASAVALQCEGAGLGPRMTLGTALVTMTISTLIVGALTVLVGKFRLAQLVQYVPLPVVGGYLGYVGYFCIAGGVALGCSAQIDSLLSWRHLLAPGAALKLVPTLATCAALMTTMERCSHPLALPAVLLAIPLAFHAVLLAGGWTLADAQAAGWVMQPTVGDKYFWKLWGLFNLQDGLAGIYWPAVWAQAPKLVGLFLVVCFGSCMDVAAIQQDVPRPLDFNRELITVGVSNCIVGLAGVGYTGSYIFSQTVFTMRAGVFNRLNGLVVAAMELAVFVLPFSVVQYCPNFFFGALLLWFGVEISRDWLLLSSRKLSLQEYLLLWFTFGAVMAFDLELGIVLGVVAATLYFAYSYAQSQVSAVRQVPAASGSVHSVEVGQLLDLLSDRVACAALAGFIFFGSAIAISDEVHKVADTMMGQVTAKHHEAVQQLEASGAQPLSGAAGQAPQQGEQVMMDEVAEHKGSKGSAAGNQEQLRSSAALVAVADAPLFIILNMRQVSNVDATGARTFSSMVTALASRGIRVLFVGLRPTHASLRRLLAAHGIVLQVPNLPAALGAGAGHPASSREPQGRGGADGVSGKGREDVPGVLLSPPSGECVDGQGVDEDGECEGSNATAVRCHSLHGRQADAEQCKGDEHPSLSSHLAGDAWKHPAASQPLCLDQQTP